MPKREDDDFHYDPRKPDRELEPGERYDVDAQEPEQPPEGNAPKEKVFIDPRTGKKGKGRKNRDPGYGLVEEKYRDRMLEDDDRNELDDWRIPALLVAIGLIGCCVVAIVAGSAKGSVVVALVAFLILMAAFVVETVACGFVLHLLGQFMGIHYGPFPMALFKIAGMIVFTTAIAGCGGGISLLPTGFVAALLFQKLFRLELNEAWISTIAIAFTSFLVKGLFFFVIFSKILKAVAPPH